MFRAQSPKNSELASTVKMLLSQLDYPTGQDRFIKELIASDLSLQEALLMAVFHTAMSATDMPDDNKYHRACHALRTLRTVATELEDKLWKHIGFNRELPIDPSTVQVELSVAMFDDEEIPSLLIPTDCFANVGVSVDGLNRICGKYVEIASDELYSRLLREGVVSRLYVSYPRADRYGIPLESTFEGGREWLWQQGFAVSPNLVVEGEDRGDDGMASCDIVVHITPSLLQEILDECVE